MKKIGWKKCDALQGSIKVVVSEDVGDVIVFDWERFGEGARLCTPDAQFIMEYSASAVSEPGAYAEDADKIRAWLAG